ncbi:ATP-binding protein, partial [Patescibacteria group bacterium]|nr:ATP-binding protein [Patescibacteria group bacterium]
HFDLDKPLDIAEFASIAPLDLARVMNRLGEPELIIIDEAQREPAVGRIVKSWYDQGIKANILLLGSSTLQLLDKTAEPLTGRNKKIGLTPLTLMERLESESWYRTDLTQADFEGPYKDQVQAILLEHMIYGGYPHTVTTAQKEAYLRNLVDDYLLRDVLQIGSVREPDLVRKLLMMLAGQIGCEVRSSEIGNRLGVDRRTIERYIELLEQSYVIFSLPSYSTNPRTEISKGRKYFFWDTGVRNAIIGNFDLDPLRTDIGSLFESVMVAEFAKLNALRGHEFDLYFWRSTTQSEVDLVVSMGGRLYAYEAKWSKASAWAGRAFSERYQAPVTVMNKDNIVSIVRQLVKDNN